MSPPLFNWPPFKLVALDADTGKPLDPTVGMRVKREFYNVKKDKHGKKMVVVHKNGDGSKKGEVMLEDVKKNGNGNKGGNGGNGNAAKDGNGNGGGEEKKDGGGFKGEDVPFTNEEDAKLKEMKADNKTWKEIIEEMKRPKKVLQDRWKEINLNNAQNKDGDAGAKKGGDDKKDNSGGGKKQDKKDKGKDNNNKPDKSTNNDNKSNHKSAPKAASVKAASKAGSGEARFTMGEWMTLQEDDLFSFGELQCISELIMRDEHQRWLRVASMFADKTGRRVHSDDIRDKFEEIGRMG